MYDGKLSSSAQEEVLREADTRMTRALEQWSENHDDARDDINFRDGEQYSEDLKKSRNGRPLLKYNQSETYISQVTGPGRRNRFAIQINPVDVAFDNQPKVSSIAGTQDYDLSNVYEGLIRQIEYQSSAEDAYDTALDHAAGSGFGFWRILTDYADDDGFDKEIYIRRIPNPLAVAIDLTEPGMCGEGSNYGFIWGWMARDEIKRRYGVDAAANAYEGVGVSTGNWYDGENCRIAEYFRRVTSKRKVVLLDSMERIDLGTESSKWKEHQAFIESHGGKIREARTVDVKRVEWFKLCGCDVLEGPIAMPTRYIPIVMVAGRELNVDGKYKYRSVIRYAKDAMTAYGYRRNVVQDRLAMGALAPWVGPAEAFAGWENLWRNANAQPLGFLPYNQTDTKKNQLDRPQRVDPPQIPTGDVQEAQASEADIKLTTGITSAALGQMSNERSGVAIRERKVEADDATFVFHDNLQKAIRHSARILLELIPAIYDNDRILRIRSAKGETDQVRVNIEHPITGEKFHDLGAAKFDLVVKAGGNYMSQREEFVDTVGQIISRSPETLQLLGDVFFENMDFPGAHEVAERLSAMLPPQVKAMIQAKASGQDPAQIEQPITPDQVQQAVAQAVQQAVEGQKAQLDAMLAQIKAQEAEIKQYAAETDRIAVIEKAAADKVANTQQIEEMFTDMMAQLFSEMQQQGAPVMPGQMFRQ